MKCPAGGLAGNRPVVWSIPISPSHSWDFWSVRAQKSNTCSCNKNTTNVRFCQELSNMFSGFPHFPPSFPHRFPQGSAFLPKAARKRRGQICVRFFANSLPFPPKSGIIYRLNEFQGNVSPGRSAPAEAIPSFWHVRTNLDGPVCLRIDCRRIQEMRNEKLRNVAIIAHVDLVAAKSA